MKYITIFNNQHQKYCILNYKQTDITFSPCRNFSFTIFNTVFSLIILSTFIVLILYYTYVRLQMFAYQMLTPKFNLLTR